jgi:hypothetical protein
MRVDAAMPVEAALEGGVQHGRAQQLLRPLEHLIQLLGPFLPDMAERHARRPLGEGGVEPHAPVRRRAVPGPKKIPAGWAGVSAMSASEPGPARDEAAAAQRCGHA